MSAPRDVICPDCRAAWAGDPAVIYHDPGCPHAAIPEHTYRASYRVEGRPNVNIGGRHMYIPFDEEPATTAEEPPQTEPLVRITTTSLDGYAVCDDCEFTTAGSDIEPAAIAHSKQTGHTTVLNARAIQRIRPA